MARPGLSHFGDFTQCKLHKALAAQNLQRTPRFDLPWCLMRRVVAGPGPDGRQNLGTWGTRRTNEWISSPHEHQDAHSSTVISFLVPGKAFANAGPGAPPGQLPPVQAQCPGRRPELWLSRPIRRLGNCHGGHARAK
jgi:hypothetical protein